MTRTDGDETRERIRVVARDLFALHGYAGTSLRLIADELDLTKAALYYHYRGKEELLEDVMTPILEASEHLLDEAESAVGPTDGERPDDGDRRRFLARYVDEVLLAHATLGRIFISDPAVSAQPALARRVAGLAERLAVVLRASDTPADVVRATAALGAAHAVLQLEDLPADVVCEVATAASYAALTAVVPTH